MPKIARKDAKAQSLILKNLKKENALRFCEIKK